MTGNPNWWAPAIGAVARAGSGAGVVAFLVNPASPGAETQLTDARAAARNIGQDILVVNAGSEHDLDIAFATLQQQRAGRSRIGSRSRTRTRQPLLG
jgi:NaMN:DMB phosphoribosyltransferase